MDYKTNAWSFFLLGVATLECVRHQARWFILTVRIIYRATCLTHSRVATPNRGTNMPFLSIRNTNLDYKTNAWSFFLLGVATLECVRHQARWFILTVRLIYRAR